MGAGSIDPMTLRRSLAAAAVALTTLGAPAGAMSVWIDQQDPASPFGTKTATFNERWFVNQHVQHLDKSGKTKTDTYSAGMFRLTLNDGSGPVDFNAFCVDILETLTLPATYKVVSNLFGKAITDRIDALITHAFILDDPNPSAPSQQASAFQLALWEIVTDSTLDLYAGDFMVAGAPGAKSGAQKARDRAADWLAKIASGQWAPGGATFSYFVAEGTQDLTGIGIDIVPIPLPAGLLLIGTGVAGIAMLRRRPA
jgi:hypothetical protein